MVEGLFDLDRTVVRVSSRPVVAHQSTLRIGPARTVGEQLVPVEPVEERREDRITRPPVGKDGLLDERPGTLEGRLVRGRLELEAAHHSLVPQGQRHQRGQLLSGQVVAQDAIQPEFPVLLSEAVLELSIPTAVAEKLRTRLSQLRRRPKRQALEPIEAPPGPRTVQSSLFLPARARQTYRALFDRVTLHVEVDRAPAPRPRLTLVADDDADRQRRRRTWDQNLARHALPDDARLHIRVEGASRILRDMLNQDISPKVESAIA